MKALRPFRPFRPLFCSTAGVGSATPDYAHVILYGQSLALGDVPSGASVVSSSSATDAMFSGGVRAHYDYTGIAANPNVPITVSQLASFAALSEQLNPDNSDYGETFASGIAAQVSAPCLVSSTGRSAYKVSQLQRDGAGIFADANHYQNTCATVIHAKELARAAGKSYVLAPVVFKQAEADAAASTSRATWKTEVLELQASLAADLGAASLSDQSALKLIVDQQSYSQAGTTYAELAVAAIDLHRESGGKVICAGPTYPEEFASIIEVHFDSAGYRKYGERLGLAVQGVLSGAGWNPCYITGVSRTGTAITVNVHVPTPPLVIDTTLVASVASSGFTYSGANITDVSITDASGVVTITIDADAGGNLGYAYGNGSPDARSGPTYGARGNLRDSATALRVYDGAHLYNHLCNDLWAVA